MGNSNQSRSALTAVDCGLKNTARPHSPDSLERPNSRKQQHHYHGRDRSHTLQRASTRREHIVTADDGRRISKSSLIP
ncbi:hypothetical protein SK128_019627, partial [Halocaridina rubra]